MRRSKAEEAFIDQYTRKLMVDWAAHMILYSDGSIVKEAVQDDLHPEVRYDLNPYIDHALAKGWLTKREPHRLTAKGFGVAAAFLKR